MEKNTSSETVMGSKTKSHAIGDDVRDIYMNVLGMEFKGSDDDLQIEVKGFSAQDFDYRTGYLSLSSILQQFYLVRIMIMTAKLERPSDQRMHLKHLMLTISPKLHRRWTSFHDFVMLTTCTLADYGKTSITLKQTISRKASNETLATNFLKLVNVDVITHKAANLPKENIEQLNSNLTIQEILPFCQTLTPPDSAYHCQMLVPFSDSDMFLHTSHIAYLKYILDCGRLAAESGHFTKLRQDLALYPLLRIEGMYMQESKPGDLLSIACWEDTKNKATVHGVIYKNKEQIFYGNMSFQSEKSHL